jgi:hypothetical protein
MLNGKLGTGGGARWRSLLVAAVATIATLWSTAALATITQGDFSVFGFFETRESGRWGEGSSTCCGVGTLSKPSFLLPAFPLMTAGHAATESGGSFDFNHWDLVEMRQLGDIRPDYHIVKNYKLLGRIDTLVLKDADFFAFYRPWYDAAGTLKSKGRAETNRDWHNYSHSTLQQQDFENTIHEWYAQLNFTDNFSARVGKQEVIWSEADALSGTEITNSIDTTYHWLHFENAEDQRKNLRMLKLNYILPDFLKTANNEIEGFWIPGDWEGGGLITNVTDARSPWVTPAPLGPGTGFNQNGQPFRNQMFPDSGARGMFFSPVAGNAGIFFDEPIITTGRTPSNSLQNSEFGLRLSSLLPIGNGLQASFIYLYEARESRIGLCTNCTPQSASQAAFAFNGPAAARAAWAKAAPGVFTADGFNWWGAPGKGVPLGGTLMVMLNDDIRRNNYFGATGTYYDKDLTDIVYRYDFLYAPRVGVATTNKAHPGCAIGGCQGPGAGPGSGSAWTEQTRWILAGDRPTYIPWISKQHTFITFQYTGTFWPDRHGNYVPFFGNFAGKIRRYSSFYFLAATNWLMNGQLTALNVFEHDVDDNTFALSSTNTYRYSRNVLFGVNAQWYLGRSGRYTDPFALSRAQRINELEFTFTYEI